jgi:hypothetical protein
VPMVAVTIGADHHVAFLNLPNFLVGVPGGIKTLVAIALREQPLCRGRLFLWEAERHHADGWPMGAAFTFTADGSGNFCDPQWSLRAWMPDELLDAISRTFHDLDAIGFLREEEVVHEFP